MENVTNKQIHFSNNSIDMFKIYNLSYYIYWKSIIWIFFKKKLKKHVWNGESNGPNGKSGAELKCGTVQLRFVRFAR